MSVIRKVLMPIVTASRINGRASLTPQQTLDKLGDRTCQIAMQSRGIDTIGTTDLIQYKYILANYGLVSPGLPATNTFCIDKTWVFQVSKADDPEAIEFVSKDYGVHSITKGPMELKAMSSGMAPNWILGHYFRLKGIRFECLPVDPVIQVGGMESSNMLIGAAVAAGSILSGANYDLGTIFCLANQFENDVHQGLTGAQGFAAAISGGAQSTEWPVHLHPYGGISHELFGPSSYQDFQANVSFLLPGKDKGSRSSVDINEKWTRDALTKEGAKEQAIFTHLSQEAAAGFMNPNGIDWIRVANAVQKQTDIRVDSCPTFFVGIEKLAKKLVVRTGNKVLRAIARPGAGGYGTPIVVYSTNEALAEEAKNMLGQKLEIDEALTAEIKKTGVVPSGWIDYRLSDRPIEFNGFVKAGFNDPASLMIIQEEEIS